MKGAVVLCENAGTGNQAAKNWAGGKSAFIAEATFGGGSVKLQAQLPSGAWYDVPSASLTAAGYYVADLPPGSYRAVNTTATAVSARLVSIPQG